MAMIIYITVQNKKEKSCSLNKGLNSKTQSYNYRTK